MLPKKRRQSRRLVNGKPFSSETFKLNANKALNGRKYLACDDDAISIVSETNNFDSFEKDKNSSIDCEPEESIFEVDYGDNSSLPFPAESIENDSEAVDSQSVKDGKPEDVEIKDFGVGFDFCVTLESETDSPIDCEPIFEVEYDDDNSAPLPVTSESITSTTIIKESERFQYAEDGQPKEDPKSSSQSSTSVAQGALRDCINTYEKLRPKIYIRRLPNDMIASNQPATSLDKMYSSLTESMFLRDENRYIPAHQHRDKTNSASVRAQIDQIHRLQPNRMSKYKLLLDAGGLSRVPPKRITRISSRKKRK